MSYSVSFIGKPAAIKSALERHSGELTGQSKTEFDEVLPALNTVLDQQVANGVIKLHAYGHASFTDGAKVYGNCGVTVEPIGGTFVE